MSLLLSDDACCLDGGADQDFGFCSTPSEQSSSPMGDDYNLDLNVLDILNNARRGLDTRARAPSITKAG